MLCSLYLLFNKQSGTGKEHVDSSDSHDNKQSACNIIPAISSELFYFKHAYQNTGILTKMQNVVFFINFFLRPHISGLHRSGLQRTLTMVSTEDFLG